VRSGASVQFVTDKRAYLNRGARDGLEVKQSVSIVRAGRTVGSCTIETVADHQATCVGGRPRPGDSLRIPTRVVAMKREPPPPALPAPTDEATLRTRAAAVADARYDKVDFTGVRALAAHTRVQVSPGFTIWHTDPDPRGDYSQEELSGALQIYDLGATGVDFAAAFTAMRWGARAGGGRFQPGAPSQFYLWEAEVTKRRADANTVFAVGRIWPWHTPGLTMLDGLQIGRRNDDGSREGGVYAGLVPVALNAAPSVAGWAAGAYGALVQTGSNRAGFRLGRQEARLGISSSPGTGLVTEGDASAQLWLGAWTVGGGGRVLLAPTVRSGPVLDRAFLDLGIRATLTFGAGLHLRYFGGALPAQAVLQAETPAPRGTLNAAADAHWDFTTWLGAAAFVGFNQDRDTARSVSYAAAELRLPRLLGDIGGVSVGGEVEEGWLQSRLLYGQLAARFADRLQILARVSASVSAFQTPTAAPNLDEIGGYLHLDGALASWLRLRAWSLIRVPFLIEGAPPTDLTYGLVVGVSLAGSL
jgi:hypothetical protein